MPETTEPVGRIPPAAVLDPRPRHAATANPFANAVNIPLEELADRTHELPPRGQTITVVGPPNLTTLAAQTVQWLADHGRNAVVAREAPRLADKQTPQTARLWRPTAFLEETLPLLKPGTALDLACGVGRDAVFAASAGWEVTAVDVLPDAIERGQALAERYAKHSAPICWVVANLERDWTPPAGPYDLIFGFRYLHRPLFARLAEWLAPGGNVLWETFTTLHRASHGRPARAEHVLHPGELPRLFNGWEIIHTSDSWRGEQHTGRIWASSAGVGQVKRSAACRFCK